MGKSPCELNCVRSTLSAQSLAPVESPARGSPAGGCHSCFGVLLWVLTQKQQKWWGEKMRISTPCSLVSPGNQSRILGSSVSVTWPSRICVHSPVGAFPLIFAVIPMFQSRAVFLCLPCEQSQPHLSVHRV